MAFVAAQVAEGERRTTAAGFLEELFQQVANIQTIAVEALTAPAADRSAVLVRLEEEQASLGRWLPLIAGYIEILTREPPAATKGSGRRRRST